MKGTNKTSKEEAEVEELLKSVEEDMLLNLALNSHTSRVSPNYIPSDLDRRLQALRSSKPPPPPSTSTSTSTALSSPPDRPVDPDPELGAVIGDDLAARFAALRASLHKPETPVSLVLGEDDELDEADEVEKLIRWAKDAARLDPSPPSDDDDDDDNDDHDDDYYDRDGSDEDERCRRAK